jgi:hypothetical protein
MSNKNLECPTDKYPCMSSSLTVGIYSKIAYFHTSRYWRDRRGRDRMVGGFTTTYDTSAYPH